MPYLSRPSDSIPSKETTIPSASTLNTSSEAETASIAPATGSDALEAAAIARQPLRSEPATNPVIPETAVSPSQGATTVEIPLGLEGYCPVELSRTERWIPGNPLYYAMYRGQIFRFSTEEALEQFQREPARYAPIAGGDDIVLMVDRNKKVAGQRKFGVWYKDRVYLFSSGVSFEAFSVKPDYYSEIAEKYETALRTHFDKVQR